MTEREKKETSTISRRQFLKNAGLLIGGTAIGSTVLLAACGGEEKTVTNTITNTTTVTAPGGTATVTKTVEKDFTQLAASEGYIIVDSEQCCGCQTCMMACSLVHEGVENNDLSRIQVIQNPYAKYPDDIDVQQCRQCVFPACVAACPTGACHVDTANGNVRLIDKSMCIGCQRCVQACPYAPSRIVWNFQEGYAQKCDLCVDTPYWSEAGGPSGKQACVESCPMSAIKLATDVPTQVANFGYDRNLRP